MFVTFRREFYVYLTVFDQFVLTPNRSIIFKTIKMSLIVLWLNFVEFPKYEGLYILFFDERFVAE